MKNVFVIILHFNGEKNTVLCLQSVSKLKSTSYNLSVIVVDNCSKKEFQIGDSKIKIDQLKVIRNRENLGFSGGNNVGIIDALRNGADYILLLNNDTFVGQDLIEELLKVALSDKDIGIVAPKIYFAKGFEFHRERYKKEALGKVIWYGGGLMDWNNVIGHHRGVDEIDHGQYDDREETDFASGCCMLIKREVLDTIGLFDDRYFLYYEDSDFSERVKKINYKIVYAPRAMLWHKNAKSTRGSGSELQDYYITRNRLLFGMQFAPLRAKVALVKESLGLLIGGRIWQKRAIIDFYGRKFGKGSYPL